MPAIEPTRWPLQSSTRKSSQSEVAVRRGAARMTSIDSPRIRRSLPSRSLPSDLMLRRPRTALLGALACLAALAVTGALAHLVPGAKVRDSASLNGFTLLGGPRLDPLLDRVAHLADPDVYAVLAAALVIAALVQRRAQLAAGVAVIAVAAPGATEPPKPPPSPPPPAGGLGDSPDRGGAG